MVSSMSKRQQARNEMVLHGLVHSVKGNNRCADCDSVQPAWASWSLGIFLCIRCAAIHRKLGTHISKVKSLSLDSWTVDQVKFMEKTGNVVSNQLYNPEKKRPPVTVDPDEADSAMERFIRTKYAKLAPHVATTAASTMQVSTTSASSSRHPRRAVTFASLSDNDDNDPPPPPPPPKSPPLRAGNRSVSNVFPLASHDRRTLQERLAHSHEQRERTPPRHPDKSLNVFGAVVDHDAADDTRRSLARLQEMGFRDSHRNAMVLRGVGGHLGRTVEAPVRLGEGDGSSLSSLTLGTSTGVGTTGLGSLSAAHSDTPVGPATIGEHADTARPGLGLGTPPTVSSNPFDTLPPQPQSSQSTGTMQTKNPYHMLNGPGHLMAQKTGQHEMPGYAFQAMSLTAPSQPLFPNHTGGFPAPHTAPAQQPHQQSTTPPVYSQPFRPPYASHQPLQTQQHMSNPFWVMQMQSQKPPGMPPSMPTHDVPIAFPAAGANPFSSTRMQSLPLSNIPEQSQPKPYDNALGISMLQQPQPSAMDTFAGTRFAPQQQAAPESLQQSMPPLFPQPIPDPDARSSPYVFTRRDNASILALYDLPHLAPQPQDAANAAKVPVPDARPVPRTASVPLPGSNNPFLAAASASASAAAATVAVASPFGTGGEGIEATGGGGISELGERDAGQAFAPPRSGPGSPSRGRQRDSMLADTGWANGRHSPDAFASLSARHP